MVERQRVLAKKLDAAGWGLFFIWIGIAAAGPLGWGAGLLGVGVIILGGQVARQVLGLPLERFGIVIGLMFCLGAIWTIADRHLPTSAVRGSLVPVVCIIAGAMLLVSAFLRRPADRVA
jgi:hypothetical protein